MKILGIPGSARSGSLNIALLRAAAGRAGPDAEVEIYEPPELAKVPNFEPGADAPPEVGELRAAVDGADALLFATPEYNGSIPGGLKNAIDWIAAPARQGPLRGKPAAVVGADRGEIGCDWAHADARKVLEMAGARVIDDGLSIESADEYLDRDDGELVGEHAERLDRVLSELISEGQAPG